MNTGNEKTHLSYWYPFMRRYWVTPIIALLAIATMANGSTLRMVVWQESGFTNQQLNKAVRQFEDTYGVEVRLDQLAYEDYGNKLIATLAAGQGDLFWVTPDLALEFASKGMLTPVRDLCGRIPREFISQEILEDFSYNGEPYGVPVGTGRFAGVAYAIASDGEVSLAAQLIQYLVVEAQFPLRGVGRGISDLTFSNYDPNVGTGGWVKMHGGTVYKSNVIQFPSFRSIHGRRSFGVYANLAPIFEKAPPGPVTTEEELELRVYLIDEDGGRHPQDVYMDVDDTLFSIASSVSPFKVQEDIYSDYVGLQYEVTVPTETEGFYVSVFVDTTVDFLQVTDSRIDWLERVSSTVDSSAKEGLQESIGALNAAQSEFEGLLHRMKGGADASEEENRRILSESIAVALRVAGSGLRGVATAIGGDLGTKLSDLAEGIQETASELKIKSVFMKANWFLKKIGLDPGTTPIVKITPGDRTRYFPSSHKIEIGKNDVSDETVILHEYGHHLMQKLLGSAKFAQLPGGKHYAWCSATTCREQDPTAERKERDKKLAWSEGFATFLGQLALKDPKYCDSNYNSSGKSIEYDVEDNTVTTTEGPRIIIPGDDVEANVQSALWDMVDGGIDIPADKDKDKLTVPVATILKIVRDKKSLTFDEFVTELKKKLTGVQKKALNWIINKNIFGLPGIAFMSDRTGTWDIFTMNTEGKEVINLTDNTAWDWHPSWSPDRGRIAFAANPLGYLEIYVMRPDGSGMVNLSNKPIGGDDIDPAWSPDGKYIAFTAHRDGNYEIYVMDANGANQRNITKDSRRDQCATWSPDGKQIAFQSNCGTNGNEEICVIAATGIGGRTNLTNNTADDGSPAWSPDGKHIAFQSKRDGAWDIYVMDANGTDFRNLTKNNTKADTRPAWSSDGKEIIFQSYRDGNWEIYIMNADGSGRQTRLTNNPAKDEFPTWLGCSYYES